MNEEHSGRHFTVAVFVVWEGKILLHLHRKLGMWLPPGGHIERDEIPDDAAVREVFEETGLDVELVGEKREDVEDPVQLHRPAGVQLENIGPGHQHIDLIYFARPAGTTEIKGDYSEDKSAGTPPRTGTRCPSTPRYVAGAKELSPPFLYESRTFRGLLTA
jgi:8-oxo-dGTP pyrophosphatase MutT (NUDIX family)